MADEVEVIGACAVCGVRFASTPARRAEIAHVLAVHESVCPGGDRAGEVVIPLE
jgi:hypothetical protein